MLYDQNREAENAARFFSQILHNCVIIRSKSLCMMGTVEKQLSGRAGTERSGKIKKE